MTSKRSQVIEPFLAVEIFQRAQELERQGKDIIHLEFGEPDFDTPPVVREAAERALKDGRTRYAHSLGLLPLREAIAEHYHARYGVTVSPAQILVTAGTSPAMLLLFSTLLDPGDEVLLTDPRYAVYPNLIRYPGGECVHTPTWEADGFQCRPAEFASRLTPRSKAVLINSPANPTGAVMTAESLRETARLGPWIISDEIYHGLTYEGAEHSILEFTDHAFVLNGFSKAYAMTGWRLGYLIAPKEFMRTLQIAHGNFFISTNEFVQWAALAALTDAGEDALRFREIFDQRRGAMVAGLRRIGLGVTVAPTGAFYVLANAQRFGADSKALAFDILEHAHVGVTPGVDFGSRAEGSLRFSYANSTLRRRSPHEPRLLQRRPVLPRLGLRRAQAPCHRALRARGLRARRADRGREPRGSRARSRLSTRQDELRAAGKPGAAYPLAPRAPPGWRPRAPMARVAGVP